MFDLEFKKFSKTIDLIYLMTNIEIYENLDIYLRL